MFLDHDERYELTDEFLTIWRQLFTEEEVKLEGKYLRIEGGNCRTQRFKNHIRHYILEDLLLLR